MLFLIISYKEVVQRQTHSGNLAAFLNYSYDWRISARLSGETFSRTFIYVRSVWRNPYVRQRFIHI